jgi:hypothetical protein
MMISLVNRDVFFVIRTSRKTGVSMSAKMVRRKALATLTFSFNRNVSVAGVLWIREIMVVFVVVTYLF